MYIPNNVLMNKLKNVYWIFGSSCGGKTTAAKYLSDKYGMYLYSGDLHKSEQAKLATRLEQPAITRYFAAEADPFLMTLQDYRRWQSAVFEEATPMILMDLVQLSAVHEVVIFEGDISLRDVAPLIPYNQMIYLAADRDLIRRDFFNRPDNHMEEYIRSLGLPPEKEKEVFDNLDRILCGLEHEPDYGAQEADALRIKIYNRHKICTVSEMMRVIIHHFGLK